MLFQKELYTSIRIHASASTVWELISDFTSYPKWNPLMLKVDGKPIQGERLEILIHLFLAADMKANPVILVAEKNKELRWKGGLAIPGILQGEHILEIETLGEHSVELIQREIWSGIMAPIFILWMGDEIQNGFRKMNSEVKTLAEGRKPK